MYGRVFSRSWSGLLHDKLHVNVIKPVYNEIKALIMQTIAQYPYSPVSPKY